MPAVDYVALIGGIAGIITAIAVGLKYRADAKSQERKDALDLAGVQQRRIEQLTTRVSCLEKKSDDQDSEIDVLQMTNLELKNEVVKLHTENVSLREQVTALRGENKTLKDEVAVLKSENAELKEENQNLRDRLEVVEARRVQPGKAAK